MREIKFRGKRISDGEWVYGYLFLDKFGREFIITPTDQRHYPANFKEVIPETVGQYIGRKDDDGNEIYEGDIVKVNRENALGEFGHFIGVVTYRAGSISYMIRDCIVKHPNGDKERWDYSYIAPSDEILVIGNIHENNIEEMI